MCINGVELCKQSSNDIKNRQVNDPDLKKITSIDGFESPISKATKFKKRANRWYIMLEVSHSGDADENDTQQVLLKSKMLSEYENFPVTGHSGVEKTTQRINGRYYWSSMSKHIKDYTLNA